MEIKCKYCGDISYTSFEPDENGDQNNRRIICLHCKRALRNNEYIDISNRKIDGLFTKCFAMSRHQKTIRYSVLPFKDGYYVTEFDTVMWIKGINIYLLSKAGWKRGAEMFDFWNGRMDDLADIQPQVVKELGLDQIAIVDDYLT